MVAITVAKIVIQDSMKNIYLIIGEGKCGKSSLVRALTGIYRYAIKFVRQTDGLNIRISIWPQSCQEGKITPEQALDYINTEQADNILITLRFKPAPGMVPYDAIEYYELFQNHHNIAQVVFMGGSEDVRNFPTNPIANNLNLCQSRPINENAAIVREWWSWR